MKNRWNRPNEYIECETGTLCKVYNYTMDTIKEMEADGWTLRGTYICFFSFLEGKINPLTSLGRVRRNAFGRRDNIQTNIF